MTLSAEASPSALERASWVQAGVRIEIFTIIWMVVEALVALMTGFATRSVSLEGFGLDSLIELLAGGILLWRLLVERRGGSDEMVEHAERRAAWVTVFGLLVLALYILIESAFALLTRSHPVSSWWGIGLAAAAAAIMPVLWQGKLRVAKRMGSAALKADAACSVTCAYQVARVAPSASAVGRMSNVSRLTGGPGVQSLPGVVG